MSFAFDAHRRDQLGTRFAQVLAFLNQLKDNGFSESPTLEDEGEMKHYEEDGRIKGRILFDSNEVQLLLTHFLEEDLDCDLNELLNARLERLGTMVTEEGRFAFHTGLQQPQVGTSASGTYLIPTIEYGTTQNVLPFHVGSGQVNSTSGLYLRARIPDNYTQVHDCEVVVAVSLNQGESAGDDIDLEVEYTAVQVGEGVNKSTTTASGVQDIGSDTSQYDLHEVRVPLTYNDATNPLVAGAWVNLLVRRVNSAQVGPVSIFGVGLGVPVR